VTQSEDQDRSTKVLNKEITWISKADNIFLNKINNPRNIVFGDYFLALTLNKKSKTLDKDYKQILFLNLRLLQSFNYICDTYIFMAINLNIKNETGKLKSVVLGQPKSNGPIPTLAESYDAKSYNTIENNIYPKEEDIVFEMSEFEKVLKKYDVEVFRPKIIKDYNQVFARDVAFVIEDKMIISNIIPDRADEQEAYRHIIDKVSWRNVINLPEKAHIEGGDVIVWDEFLFIGTSYSPDYRNLKTARTNEYAIEILKEYFPKKRIIDLDLKKSDTKPYEGILHLDCTFNPIGEDKCVIYKNGFVDEDDYQLVLDIFGEENCFNVNDEEMFQMFPNVFSIAPDVVVSDKAFTRMNDHFRNEWGITVEEIPYREISKMGGLLRCSTLPLVRE
jgi:N-dimethylarginine dimethylaminohydrolase